MNLLATLAGNEAVTVRSLINTHQSMRLKQGLLNAGVAEDSHQLHKIRDELILWDDDGNILLIPVVNGVFFETVTVRTPMNHTKGFILASMKETKKVQYNPLTVIRKEDGETVEHIDNNVLYFFRADHPDTAPFLCGSPLWLAVPEFQNLLNLFPEGNYSGLDSITQVREPKCNITTLVPVSTRVKYPDNVFPAYFENQIA
jgi:hypothetical protein